MQSFVSCFDIVKMLVDEETERLSPTLEVNKAALDRLEAVCQLLDVLTDPDFTGAFCAEINKETHAIELTFYTLSFEVTDCNAFAMVLKAAQEVTFVHAEDDKGELKFTFESIWKDA